MTIMELEPENTPVKLRLAALLQSVGSENRARDCTKPS